MNTSLKKRGLYYTVATFIVIFAVYLTTLLLLFPNLPVISRIGEEIPGYDRAYPPFRLDEYNYHTIANNILSGNVYEEGSLEKSYTIGFPAVAVPFIAILGDIGGYVANLFIMWGCLVLFYLIIIRYSSRLKSLILTAILAFATLNWFYATSCYTEPLSQFLVLLSYYLITTGHDSKKTRARVATGGLVAALNLFVRPHYILITVPFFLFLWIGKKKMFSLKNNAFFFASGTVIVIIGWIVRNTLFFGGPLSFEYTRLLDSYVPGAASSVYMKGNIFLGSHRLLFDQYHGLFTITPILLLFPAGLRTMWIKGMKRESLTLFAAVVIMALFAASSAYPFTEFGLGSRHMLPIIPLMLIPCSFFLDGKLFTSSIVTVLAVYSFYHAGMGWFTGGEPGMGFFLGILNDSQARTVILARKGLLPRQHFESQKELIDTYRTALKEANLMKLLQTLQPLVIEKIRGNERDFMLFLRRQKNPSEFILSADPENGIIIKSFSTSEGMLENNEAVPDSIQTEK